MGRASALPTSLWVTLILLLISSVQSLLYTATADLSGVGDAFKPSVGSGLVRKGCCAGISRRSPC